MQPPGRILSASLAPHLNPLIIPVIAAPRAPMMLATISGGSVSGSDEHVRKGLPVQIHPARAKFHSSSDRPRPKVASIIIHSMCGGVRVIHFPLELSLLVYSGDGVTCSGSATYHAFVLPLPQRISSVASPRFHELSSVLQRAPPLSRCSGNFRSLKYTFRFLVCICLTGDIPHTRHSLPKHPSHAR
ncbi:hypothetical protein BC827DRAFT_15069 [Russula dissimulans]|nr:hypothetical protein BC827DRAFT_15069 [Russula dissimulans]